MSDMLIDFQYDPEQDNYIYRFRMSAEKKLELAARLQPFGTTLEEAIPKYLEYAMTQEEKSYIAATETTEYLKARRHELHLTQQAVADKADIRLQQYQKFESGERSILTASFVIACKVLNALKIDIEDFYNDYAGNTAK